MCDLRSNVQQPRLHFLEGCLAPARHHRKLAFLQSDHASGNWRVQQVAAFLPHPLAKLPPASRTHPAHTHTTLAGPPPPEHSVAPAHHRRPRRPLPPPPPPAPAPAHPSPPRPCP